MAWNAFAKLRHLRDDRTARTLLIAALMLWCGGMVLNEPTRFTKIRAFWTMKLNWRGNANVVLMGDSRMHAGLAPRVMAKEFPRLTILNFGFSGLGYSDAYLNAAERVWSERGGPKIAVLGISPYSLSRAAMEDNQFVRSMSDNGPMPELKSRWKGWVETRWPSLADRQHFNQLVRQPRNRISVSYCHTDGWMEVSPLRFDVEDSLTNSRFNFQKSPVNQEVVNVVLRRTRAWVARGIQVYAFRPPTCEDMEKLENEVGRFEESTFVREFEDAGGRWLRPSHEDLCSYDGSHLDAQAAERLSERVARAISLSQQMIPERMATGTGAVVR